jgi:toxin ParE1/3/4
VRADNNAAFDYVAMDSASAADQLLETIQQAAAILARHPMAGRVGRISDTRELVVPGTPGVIPYRVRRRFVEILAVIHGARKRPEDL